jgi:hypothetical protein
LILEEMTCCVDRITQRELNKEANFLLLTSLTYGRPRRDTRESTGNNTQQVDIKTLNKVVKMYTHRRGPDIQFIPVVIGGMKDHTI